MMTTESPPQTAHKRDDIQGLRAIAVLGVIAFHGFGPVLPGGFIGVDVFFVLSGFLITGILMRELDEGRFSLGGFYRRRISRLFVGSSRVDLQACKLEYSIVSPK